MCWRTSEALHPYFVDTSAIETPGGKRIVFKNIIAQQIIRKRHTQKTFDT
jgi:hypothetical protein